MAVYFDVTHTYLHMHDRHPTGIERAVLGLCAAGEIHGARPLVFHPGEDRFYRLGHYSHVVGSPGKAPAVRLRSKIYRHLPALIRRLAEAPRDFIYFQAGSWKRSLAGRLSELERKETPVDFESGDLIYILDLNIRIPPYIPAMMRLKRAQPKLRLIGFVHDIFPLNYPELSPRRSRKEFEKWWNFLQATCDSFMTNSREVAASLASHVQNKPVRPIMFGSALAVPPDRESVALPAALANRACADGWILTVGSHMPRKNHILQLDAMEPLWGSGQLRVPLIVAGAFGPQTEMIKSRIKASPVLRQQVVLLDAVTDGQLWALYHGARLYVLSSIYEGFGLTVSEAMQCGCPCFVSRAGATPEVGGAFVEYFDPNRPDQLRNMIGRFFSDPAVEGEMRKRAQRFKPQTWESAVKDLLAGPDFKVPSEAFTEGAN